MDNMVMTIIPRDEAEQVLSALIESGHTSTFIETKGGVFRQSQYTLFIVVNDNNLVRVCEIIKTNCKVAMNIDQDHLNQDDSTSSVNDNQLGGAVVFVWKLNQIISY